ncbi:protein SMAX1-like [Selaginella moellendorffii]|uniref:protein SMAX1-like n=1 Tax=Selaginella moellendorffii TaxID=88036 RepID=UPI000D1C3F03|nr:protein SMAX1-like [Selaginella moellendorffii]|eukprot:XP_024524646.1 protein SMAX1-like [Selaginella moellendorffii]
MRAGVSTVQQTLTTEAANVLKLAVAEAQRRGHAQVTPLHVATTLLSGTTSVLRQACIQSHLHLPQPPHCRSLELCFKVALDRLQTSTTTGNSTPSSTATPVTPAAPPPSSSSSPSSLLHHHHHHHQHHHQIQQQQQLHHQHHHHQQPALSNALVAALKRAQAHQRRGYPEQQQVPLLAVKVEMEQLIISILDDPSVSRVMREASFSSTQVKNSLEEALAAAAAAAASSASGGSSTCAAQARRILPSSAGAAAAAAAASMVGSPNSTTSVDRLRLKLGSLEQYTAAAAAAAGASPFRAGVFGPGSTTTTTAPNLLIPGLLVQQSSRSIAPDHHQHHQQLNSVLMGMTIPSSGSSNKSSVDVSRVLEILLKSKKRNPLLFGEQPPHGVAQEVMHRLDKGDCEPSLSNLRILSPQFASIALGLHAKDEVERKLAELVRSVEESLLRSAGVVVYLGDLQWLVERPSPPPPPPSSGAAAPSSPPYCPVQHTVSEIGKLLAGHSSQVWLMGIASSQTYMRCQARHPSLDSLWGLQPLPISSGFSMTLRNSGSNGSARFGSSNCVESPSPVRTAVPGRWPSLPFKLQPENGSLENCCAECVAKYEQEVQENISSSEEHTPSGLPFWLKPNKDADQANGRSQKLKELQKKWSQTCRSLHGMRRNSSSTKGFSSETGANGKVACSTTVGGSLPMSIPWLSLQPQISNGTQPVPEKNGLAARSHGEEVGPVCTSLAEDGLSTDIGLSLKPSTPHSSSPQGKQPDSEVTVQTDLVLGRSESLKCNDSSVTAQSKGFTVDAKPQQQQHQRREALESLAAGCTTSGSFGFPVLPISPEKRSYQNGIDKPQVPAVIKPNVFKAPPVKELDYKGLCKALAENVPWQRDAVDAVSSTILNRAGRGNTWLLFLGPDAMAKRKVARILAEQVYGSDKMLLRLSLRSGKRQERDVEAVTGRGRTPLDRLADSVRSKPFSVVLLEDIEQADPRLKSSLVKAMERGRLADSSGREVSVANLIVIMTSSIGEELLPQENQFTSLELNEKIIAGTEIVGMKLVAAEAADPEAVLHKGERVSVIRSSVPSDSTSHSKRKAGASDLMEAPAAVVEKRNKVESRGVELDLNLPLEEDEAAPKAGDNVVEKIDVKDSQVKLLLERACDQLSKNFWDRMSGTIVFRPFNFTKLAELVVKEISTAASGPEVTIEVESTLFKHLVAVVWEGQGRNDEFQRWVTQVLEKSVLSLVEKHKLPEQHIIKLLADRSDPADAVLHLPNRIKIGDEGT